MSTHSSSTDRPNIVILLLDSARADRFSCYGHHRNTTPFIDSLAARGTRYDAAYATSIWSLPVYASLFTGELPVQHGAVDWECTVGKNTLVSRLNDGYTSYCISPHLLTGEYEVATKFDENFFVEVPHKELLFDPDPVITELRGSDEVNLRTFVEEWWKYRTFRTFPNAANQVLKKKRYDLGWWDDSGAENVFTSVTHDMLQQEPFFMFMNFVETHKPYIIPRKWARMYTDASPTDINRVNRLNTKAATAGAIDISEDDRQLLLDLCDGSLRYLDHLIEQFYQRLEDEGVAENTVFVILSDHGDLFGEAGVWEHQALIHPYLCNVPLVISPPWETPDSVHGPVSIRSLCQGMIDLSNGEQAVPSGENEVFVEYKGWDTNPSSPPWETYGLSPDPWKWYQVSCVTDTWRLRWRADDHVELYHITDYAEHHEISSEHPDVVSDLQSRIQEQVGHPEQLHEACRNGGTHELTAELTDRLEDLGYM